MFNVNDRPTEFWDPLLDGSGNVELLLEPFWEELSKGPVAYWCIGKIRFQESIEFAEWLFVKANMIQLLGGNPSLFQTILNMV